MNMNIDVTPKIVAHNAREDLQEGREPEELVRVETGATGLVDVPDS